MKDYKKIVYFLDFPSTIGGSNKVLLTQAYIMKQKGYQVKIIIPNDEEGVHTEEYDRICEAYQLEMRTAYYTMAVCMEEINIMASLDEYKEIMTLLEEDKPDLIHSTQLNIAVELAARELKIPHLMNIYQVDEQTFNIRWMNIYPQYHSADSVMMSERWSGGLGIPSKCIRGAYEVKENGLRREKDCDTAICILLIGVLCRRKNQLECLKFILECKKNGYLVNLKVFGDSQNPYGEMCKKFVKENGLKDNVQFTDFDSNVYDNLKTADLLMVTSVIESYPSGIIASMANKVPIISTPVAGVPELLRDEENGFLTDGYGAKDLYKAFLRYLECRKSGSLVQLVNCAYKIYLEHHTYEVVGNEIEKYYQWIINDFSNKKDSRVKAAQIRQELDDFMHMKGKNATQIMESKVWFLYHVISIMEKKENRKYMIWGAGFWGKKTLEWLEILGEQVEFIGFIDSSKQGNYLGFPIVNSNDMLIRSCGTIIISIGDERDRLVIMDYLDSNGKVRNKDYFLIWNGPIRA